MTGNNPTQTMNQITVEELAKRLSSLESSIQLVDVREPEEVKTASIEGFMNLPLSQFAEWGNDIQTRLELDKETFVLCHHGVRSAQMCQWLTSQGFSNVKNITGGIDAYSMLVDPSVPLY